MDGPIMFSDPLVLACYGGRKTETRRNAWGKAESLVPIPTKCQSLKPGDRLYIQESWSLLDAGDGLNGGEWCRVRYGADDEEAEFHLTPDEKLPNPHSVGNKMFMPRWMSRGTLIITRTKIERVQEITDASALAEGIVEDDGSVPDIFYLPGGWKLKRSRNRFVGVGDRPSKVFRSLWVCLNGKPSWDANPEVVALTFTAHKHNIDALKEAA